jgi:hypothetical protein
MSVITANLEALHYVYPQTPIEDDIDVQALWKEEMDYMDLVRQSYKFTVVNEKNEIQLNENGTRVTTPRNTNERHKYHYFDADGNRRTDWDELQADRDFYIDHPEWYGYMVMGRDFLARQSKAGKFSFFMPFQVDFMISFMDTKIVKMGVVANRGGAKSWLMCYCAVMECALKPGNEISILSGSEKQSKNAFQYCYDMCMDETSGVHHLVETDIKYTNSKKITFKPDPITGRVSKIFNQATGGTSTRGPRATKVIADEVTQISQEDIETTIGQAITSHDIKFVWGGTPDDPGHMAHTDWWINKPENIAVEIKNGETIVRKCHHWVHQKELPMEEASEAMQKEITEEERLELEMKMSWHLFHWDAFDCHVSKGGWITPITILTLKTTYKSYSKRQREIYGRWTGDEGTILDMEDIERATDTSIRDFDLNLRNYDGFVLSVDGARHAHYATIIVIGFKKRIAHILYAWRKNHIREVELRKKIFKVITDFQNQGAKGIHVVIEEAPIAADLIDNVSDAAPSMHVTFQTSTFKHNKNRFVSEIAGYFETRSVKIPRGFDQVIDELLIWRWSKTVRSTDGQRLPEKGNDDFIDAIMHGLMMYYMVEQSMRKRGMNTPDGKGLEGEERPEKKLEKMVAAHSNMIGRDPFL